MRWLGFIAGLLLVAGSGSPAPPALQVFPEHFRLRPGEQVHYTVMDSRSRSVDARFAIEGPAIVRLAKPEGMIEAMKPGLTEMVVRTPSAQRRIPIEVTGSPQQPMKAVPHTAIREIAAQDLLFVGHANLDGYDRTASAKPGIDLLVRQARKNGWTVVYWVSQEYPDWYTDDRRPDYAIISEGQEHQIRIEAQRVVFAGGSFMFCLLRNVQMTLHSMIRHHVAPPIHFVFPMVTLSSWFARSTTDARKYGEVVVPFLDRMISEFPVAGYPPDPPSPPLKDLLARWTIVVRFGERFERVYRRGDPDRVVLFEFTMRS